TKTCSSTVGVTATLTAELLRLLGESTRRMPDPLKEFAFSTPTAAITQCTVSSWTAVLPPLTHATATTLLTGTPWMPGFWTGQRWEMTKISSGTKGTSIAAAPFLNILEGSGNGLF